MRLAITIYPDDFAQADRVIHLLRQERSLELDSYMGKESCEKHFSKPAEYASDDKPPKTQAVARPNVTPGAPTTSRVTSATMAVVQAKLANGEQPGLKFDEAAKLMWSRGELGYDGEKYYNL